MASLLTAKWCAKVIGERRQKRSNISMCLQLVHYLDDMVLVVSREGCMTRHAPVLDNMEIRSRMNNINSLANEYMLVGLVHKYGDIFCVLQIRTSNGD